MENYYDVNAPKIELPNATAVLILGIASIVCCCGHGILGIICGIIALVLAKTATNLYDSNPGKYTEGSFKNMNAGKICALIGLSLSVIYLILSIVLIAIVGISGLTDPNAILENLGIPV